MFLVILDSVTGLLQIQLNSLDLGNSAIITNHTDMAVSHILTQRDINATPMEHTASWEVETRSAL
jgi:Tfp pilus assembly protein PilV